MSDVTKQSPAGPDEASRRRRAREELLRDQLASAERMVALKRKALRQYVEEQRERRARAEALGRAKSFLGGFLIDRLRAGDAEAWRLFEAMGDVSNERDKERYLRLREILSSESGVLRESGV